MHIRELQAHELQALLALYEHLHERDDPLPPLAEVEAVWSEALASPRIKYFGGFAEGALVASCTLTVIPNLTRACRPALAAWSLGVENRSRRDVPGHPHRSGALFIRRPVNA